MLQSTRNTLVTLRTSQRHPYSECEMRWISEALGALKLPPKVIGGIAIAAGALVLAPHSWIQTFGLDGFMRMARPYVSLLLIVASSILLVELVVYLKAHVANALRRRKAMAKLIEHMESLDPAERIVLREFFIQGQSTVRLPMDQPVVAGLIQKGIIYRVGALGERTVGGMTFSFRIRDEALRLLNIDQLGLPVNPTEEDKRRIIAERPPYMTAIQEHERLFHSPRWR